MSVTAIILAAGKGTRMQEPETPKVMFPVGGVPMIDHVVAQAIDAGADNIVVVIGHNREIVRRHLISRFGRRIVFAEQTEQLGTGHAVMQAMPLVQPGVGELLILSGDVPLLAASTLRSLAEHHRKTRACATVLTVIAPDPTGYGRIVRRDDGIVERVVEHRDASERELGIDEINSGIYIFNTSDLADALSHVRPDNAQGEYYLTDVFAWFRAHNRHIEAWCTDDYDEVHGINTREQLEAADREWTRRRENAQA